MRLPDPFTPNLKVNLLPEISQSPLILSDYTQPLLASNLKQDIDFFLKSRSPSTFLAVLGYSFLSKDPLINSKYDVSVINSLVLYVGVQSIALQSTQDGPLQLKQTASMEIFQQLMVDLDSEGSFMS